MAARTQKRERGGAEAGGEGVAAVLFAADGADREVVPDRKLIGHLADDVLLWIDVDTSEDGAAERVAGLLSLEPAALTVRPGDGPFIRDYDQAFVLGVLPLPVEKASSSSDLLLCAAGGNWLATFHQKDVGSIKEFADHLRGDTSLGRLDSASFLAEVLEWVLSAYFSRLDEYQEAVDEIEETMLRERGRGSSVEQLVSLRHDVGQLRRRLSPHRQVLATLTHPGVDVVSGSDAASEFQMVAERLETALETVDTTREMIVEAFDVFMTQTAQRTNEIMRVLTTVSVALLPAALIAGILGMNMLPKYLLHPWVTWAALALMVAISGALVLLVRAWFARR